MCCCVIVWLFCCFLFAKVSNFIQKAIVFGGTGVTSSANAFVTICFTERYTEASPDPYSLPRPLRKEGSENPTQPPRRGRSAYAHTRDKGRALYLIVFCKILANLHSPPFGGVGGGCRGRLFLFPITQSQSQNHKKDFQCVKKGFLYNIIPY